MHALEVADLEKRYGAVTAVDGMSFHVDKGEVFGLIGPNGAGKTTTLRIVSTLILPSSGKAVILGHDVVREPDAVRPLISYLAEDAGTYRNLTGYEYLDIVSRLYFDSAEKSRIARDKAIEVSGLNGRIRDRMRTYSKGMKRRLQIARALMTEPKLAVLDEPTYGLDVVQSYRVRQMIMDFARNSGVAVLLSSHNMLEVEYLCDRVALVFGGKILETGRVRELVEDHGASNLEEVFMKVVRDA